MSVGNVARVSALLVAVIAAAGSASSSSSGSQNQASNPNDPNGPSPAGADQAMLGAPSGPDGQSGPPAAQQMDPQQALGLWRSTFGAVKIEPDASHGGLSSGSVQGVWVYQRQGQEVIGYFAGNLRGNVLQFHWQEPNDPPLTGQGFLVFEPHGRQYSGRWWSDHRDRVGDWNGWRQPGARNAQAGAPGPGPGPGPAEQAPPDDGQPPPQPRQRQPYAPSSTQPAQSQALPPTYN